MKDIIKEEKIFLGNKRKDERINSESSETNKKIKNSEEKILRQISSIGPALNKINDIEKNKIYLLNEKKEENDNNIQINENKNTNSISKKIKENKRQACEKCGKRNNVLIFNSCKDILDYLASINLFNLFIKNSSIFNKYLKLKYNQPKKICSDCLLKILNNQLELENFIRNNEFNNEYPFNDLLDNINLKNFNSIETPIKKPILNYLNQIITKKKQPMNSVINNLNNNSPNSNPNLIMGYINPFTNQLIPNIFNYTYFSQIANLNRPVGMIPFNNKNICINEKEKENNITTINNDLNDYVKIKKKDFDELFNLVGECYHKLLSIKNNRELNLNLNDSSQKQDNSNSNLYNDVNNKETYNNQFNDNFNKQLWNNLNKNINNIISDKNELNDVKK